jgi:hypothetical protein
MRAALRTLLLAGLIACALGSASAQSAAPPSEAKPQPQFNLDDISRLLDQAKAKNGNLRLAVDARSPPGIGGMLRAQMNRCWRAPYDLPNPARLIVSVRVSLARDGSLAKPPRIVSEVAPDDVEMRVAADNALHAVRVCAPYTLPADSYEMWREVTFTFDPRAMMK